MPQHASGNAPPGQKPLKGINWIDNATILTPTGGFLKDGFTHTLNASVGCAFAGASCGTFCYAQHNHWITKGRPWALYGVKRNLQEAYRREYDQIKHPRRGTPRPLNIYMSSSTDPYIPQEKNLEHTLGLLEEMRDRPPDVLVIQTHNTLIERDLAVIQALAARCELWVSITCETDMERVPGFPRHASSPRERLEVLKMFREAGVQTQATISPLMPLSDPEAFARQLDAACVRVIVDHYLLGDGSKGLRTKRTNFEQLLQQAGFGEWTKLEKMWEVRDILAGVLGEDRVLVSAAGFNAVGQTQTAAIPGTQPETPNLPMVIAPTRAALVVADTKALSTPAEAQPRFRLNSENLPPEDFNELLRRHQWEKSKPLAILHIFLPPIIKRFFEDLPLPALSWSTSSRGTLGWYLAQDGLALNHRINLNSMYASQTFGVILMALTHELCHEWQYLHGTPGKYGYHNKEFQRKCLDFGIPCTDKGHSLGMQEPFVSFLKELGVEADSRPFRQEEDEEERPSKKGSRLKPWSCGCTRIWASIRVEVEATCAKCKNPFQRQ